MNFLWQYLISFKSLPPEAITIIVSMIPIGELRVGLPLAISSLGLNWWEAYIFSVVGNFIPVIFILKLIGPVSSWLAKNFSFFKKFFDWLFERTRNKLSKNYELYGLWALALFVAVPLPITGAWTGALAAWLFGLDWKKSAVYILIGIMLAGIVVTLITTGILGFLSWLL
jgi:uncharacterized membrane protein